MTNTYNVRKIAVLHLLFKIVMLYNENIVLSPEKVIPMSSESQLVPELVYTIY